METASSMTPKTVEEVRGSLDLTDNGSIKNSIENCLTVLENDPVLSGAICYNCLTERVDIVKPMGWTGAHLPCPPSFFGSRGGRLHLSDHEALSDGSHQESVQTRL